MFRKLIVFLMVLSLVFVGIAPSVFAAFTAANIGPTTDLAGDVNVPTGKGYYINGTLLAVGDITNAADINLSNIASVAIPVDLLSDTADTDGLGSATKEWLALYIGDAGKIYLGLGQDVELYRSEANVLTITASGGVVITAAGLTVGGSIVSDIADTDNLGSATVEWKEIYISDAGHLYLGSGQDTNLQRTGAGILTLTAANGVVTSAGLTVTGNLLPAAAATHALGSGAAEWTDLYLDDTGYVYFGIAQDVTIQRNAANELTLTASSGVTTSAKLTVTGNVEIGANDLITTGEVGRDQDNFIGFAVDDSLAIKIGTVAHAIVSITDGAGDNDKLVTQGYVDDAAATGGLNYILHCMDVDAADADYVHAAIVGTGASQDVTTAITNPDYGRNITVTSTAGSVGVVTITGTTADGTTDATDAITIDDGTIAYGVKAFVYVSNINTSAAFISPEEVTIGIGDVIGLQNAISAEADIYMKTVDGVEEYGEIAGNANTTYNTLDCATIAQNEDITIMYHP